MHLSEKSALKKLAHLHETKEKRSKESRCFQKNTWLVWSALNVSFVATISEHVAH